LQAACHVRRRLDLVDRLFEGLKQRFALGEDAAVAFVHALTRDLDRCVQCGRIAELRALDVRQRAAQERLALLRIDHLELFGRVRVRLVRVHRAE